MASRCTGAFKKNREKTYINNISKHGSITCEYCGKNGLVRCGTDHNGATIDHKVPVSSGGSVGSLSNMVVSCYSCNQKKGPMSYEEFLSTKSNNDNTADISSELYSCA
jgi:5-methylcytosine-specific restriction endonuclease McrA